MRGADERMYDRYIFPPRGIRRESEGGSGRVGPEGGEEEFRPAERLLGRMWRNMDGVMDGRDLSKFRDCNTLGEDSFLFGSRFMFGCRWSNGWSTGDNLNFVKIV